MVRKAPTQLGFAQQMLSASVIQFSSNLFVTHSSQAEFYDGIYRQDARGIGNFDNYNNRELPNSLANDGAGVIRYDNNRDNIYKKAGGLTVL